MVPVWPLTGSSDGFQNHSVVVLGSRSAEHTETTATVLSTSVVKG